LRPPWSALFLPSLLLLLLMDIYKPIGLSGLPPKQSRLFDPFRDYHLYPLGSHYENAPDELLITLATRVAHSARYRFGLTTKRNKSIIKIADELIRKFIAETGYRRIFCTDQGTGLSSFDIETRQFHKSIRSGSTFLAPTGICLRADLLVIMDLTRKEENERACKFIPISNSNWKSSFDALAYKKWCVTYDKESGKVWSCIIRYNPFTIIVHLFVLNEEHTKIVNYYHFERQLDDVSAHKSTDNDIVTILSPDSIAFHISGPLLMKIWECKLSYNDATTSYELQCKELPTAALTSKNACAFITRLALTSGAKGRDTKWLEKCSLKHREWDGTFARIFTVDDKLYDICTTIGIEEETTKIRASTKGFASLFINRTAKRVSIIHGRNCVLLAVFAESTQDSRMLMVLFALDDKTGDIRLDKGLYLKDSAHVSYGLLELANTTSKKMLPWRVDDRYFVLLRLTTHTANDCLQAVFELSGYDADFSKGDGNPLLVDYIGH
jgi:hypothetical protein